MMYSMVAQEYKPMFAAMRFEKTLAMRGASLARPVFALNDGRQYESSVNLLRIFSLEACNACNVGKAVFEHHAHHIFRLHIGGKIIGVGKKIALKILSRNVVGGQKLF